MAIKFRVEYEITPIRFVDVFCPSCKHGFDARGNGMRDDGGEIYDEVDLNFSVFKCPKCALDFSTRGKEIEIEAE
jgi:transposase-like protein